MKLRTKILGINFLALILVLVAVTYLTAPVILNARGADSVLLFIGLMLGIGAASILVSTLLLQAMVIKRIEVLTKKVNHIKDYRSYYDALEYSGRDEVAVLAKAINQMLQRIVSSTNEVGQLNAQLQEEKAGVEKEVQDRTEQLNAEKARLKASVANLSLGFVMTDMHSNILLINKAARQILEPDADSDNGRIGSEDSWTLASVAGRFGKNFALVEKMAKSLRNGQAAEYTDIGYRDHVLRIIINPIRESHLSMPLGCVIVLEDVTDQKVMERSRDEFFSIASHELRTPLTAIRGNTALIKQYYEKKVHDAMFSEMVDDIHGASTRLIRIVNDFLDASRLEQGKIAFHSEVFDISDVLENVVYETAAIAKERGDTIVVGKTLKDVPQVYADRDRVKQIIYNLIGNALRFTENGTLTIGIEKQGSMLKVSVTDTGLGISAKDQEMLFHKFRQVNNDSLTRETSRGTGLGLYISKLLVNQMGGTIGLERSELGKGSTFVFTLPVYKA